MGGPKVERPFYLNWQECVNIILNSCTANPPSRCSCPTVSGEHQGLAIRGYNTRSATDYRLLAVPLTGGAPALDEAAVTEWLGHQASPLASRSPWEWALLLRLRLVSALAVSLHLNAGLTSTHLANQPNALQPHEKAKGDEKNQYLP